MGDWQQRADGRWVYDEDAPTPGVEATQIIAIYTPGSATEQPAEPPGHDVLFLDAAGFPSFDEVDSRTIVDPGAPA